MINVRKEELSYYILPALPRLWSSGETVGNILDVPYISKNTQVCGSALVLCHAHNVEQAGHTSANIESTGRETGAEEGV